MKTQIDKEKENAQMLIEYANGGSYTVNTKGKEISGRGVKKQYGNGNYEVTRNKLESLKDEMSWHVNF